jgi:chemotaxis protein MotB
LDASPTPPASPPKPPPVVVNSKRYKKNLHALAAPSSHRWMVSYADFLTLLFALFVMLYSISSINEDKYRQLVSRLSGALNLGTPTDNNTQVIVQEKIVKVVETKEVEVVVPTAGIAVNLKASAREEGSLDPLVIGFQPLLKEYKAPDGVGVALHVGEGWVELTVPSALMFTANGQTLTRSGERLLDEVAKTLKNKNFAVNVESFYHSEETPNPDIWPSSWLFTAIRASNVVMGLESRGVDPTRLQASGYGAYYPIATNTDPQGRAMNDRINLWIGFFDELRSRVLQLEQFELSNQAKRDSPKSASKRNAGQ